MTSTWLLALFILVAIYPSLFLREYVRAFTAHKLGDPTPKLWGLLRLDPKAYVDTFGSVILPGLIVLLLGAGLRVPPFAYAKPLPLDPNYLRNPRRDTVIISAVGPLSNLAIALGAGVILRLTTPTGSPFYLVYAFLYVNLTFFVFNLMPIPGLDGARMLSLVLSPRVRMVFLNLEQYLILFILVIYFLLGGLFLNIVTALSRVTCEVVAGPGPCKLFQ